VLGADNIGAACQVSNVYLLHISSGCIQESVSENDAKRESDSVDPVCFYGWTKAWAEDLLVDRSKKQGLRVLIPRPRQLLSSAPSNRNALVKMLTYSKFIDTPNSCTVVEDLLDVTGQLVEQDVTGVINVANPGVTSPLKIAKRLRDLIQEDMHIEEISKKELDTMTIARRIDCVLNTDVLQGLGIQLQPLDVRLDEIILELKANLEGDEGGEILEATIAETREKLA